MTLCISLYAFHTLLLTHFILCISLYSFHLMHCTISISLCAMQCISVKASLFALNYVHTLWLSSYAFQTMNFTLCSSINFSLCISDKVFDSLCFRQWILLYETAGSHFILFFWETFLKWTVIIFQKEQLYIDTNDFKIRLVRPRW